MNAIIWMLPLAAALLALERLAYFLVWRDPDAFKAFCARPSVARLGDEVDVLQKAFYGFKVIQVGVITAWCFVFDTRGAVPLPTDDVSALLAGAGLLVFGQALNFLVFRELGRTGVFYGNRFGRDVPWKEGFPFSTFDHPQYLGAALSFWGIFLLMRFPEPDWIVLPLLMTLYYAVGARLER